MSIDKDIKKYCTNKSIVKIIIQKQGSVDGMIISFSDIGCLIAKVFDFHIDGYMFISHKAIKEIKYDRNQKHYNMLYNQYGKKIPIRTKLPISSYEILSSAVKDKLLIITGNKKHMQAFCKILNVKSDTIEVKTFTSQGKRDEKISIPYNTIATIEYCNEYLKVYEKIMKI